MCVFFLNVAILKDFDLKLLYLKQNNMKAEFLPAFQVGCMLKAKFSGSA